MAKLVITIEGGIVQGVTSDSEELIEVCILDFDTDGQDVPEIKDYSTGNKQHCNIYVEPTGLGVKYVNHYFNELKKVEK